MANIYIEVDNYIYKLEKGQEKRFPTGVLLKSKAGQEKYLAQCKAELVELLRNVVNGKGSLLIVIRGVSASGTSMSLYVSNNDLIRNLSYLVSVVLGSKYKEPGCTIIYGCKIDMVHHTVECLSMALYGCGNKIRAQVI